MGSSLAHVMVVAGTRREWAAVDEAGWRRLAAELAPVVADAGGAWLTIRAYEAGPPGDDDGDDGAGSAGAGDDLSAAAIAADRDPR